MKKRLAAWCLVGSALLTSGAWAADPAADAAPPAPVPPSAAAEAAPAAESKPAAPAAKPAAPAPAAPPAADAEEPESPAPEEQGGKEHADEDFGHGFQLGLRAGVVGGYRMVFRYDKSPFCRQPDPDKLDKDQQKFCGHSAPFAADVALSFAPVDFAEPYVWVRFGFAGEKQTNTNSLLAVGAGARIYTMSDSKLKIFVEPAIAAELEGGGGSPDWKFDRASGNPIEPEYKTDLLIHLAVGPQYDFAQAFGAYAHAGITTGVLRAISTELEVSLGVQLRVP